jgi:CubicO group peptidase (beta-lactamase class C family)
MKRINKLLALLCLSTPLLVNAAPQPNSAELTTSNLEAWLDGQTEAILRNQDLAGMSIIVIKDGDVLLSKGYGYADIESKKVFSPDHTLIRPGSVAKLFTWTAVMQLVEQGKLDLDTDVNQYLDFELPSREGGAITLRHLMTHRAGFEEAVKGLFVHSVDEMLSLDQWLKKFIPQRIFAVDTTAAYSNYGVGLAGYIVQRVSRTRFEDYVAQNILKPLGMRNSTFEQPVPADIESKVASAYMLASTPKLAFELITPSPAGGLSATAADMGKFIQAYLSEQSGQKLIQDSTRAEMLNFTAPNLPEMKPMALGFFRSDRNGLKILSHGGDTRYFHSDLILIPEKKVGLFLSISGFGKEFYAARLRSDITNGFIDRYFPAPSANELTPLTDTEHDVRAAAILGKYQVSRASFSTILATTNPLGQTSVSLNADKQLIVDAFKDGAGNPWKWIEVRPHIWQQLDGSAKLSFEKDLHGIWQMTVDSGSPVIQWRQVQGLESGGFWVPVLLVSLVAIIIHIIASLSRVVVCWRYKLEKQWTKSVTGFRWSSVVYLLSVGVFSVGMAQLQDFKIPDAMFRIAQIGTAVGFILTVLFAIPVVMKRFKQRTFFKAFSALVVVIAQLLIVVYLTMFNFWSADLMF